MAANNGNIKIVKRYRDKHPLLKQKTLARLIFKENPNKFKSIEHARTSIRQLERTKGVRSRAKKTYNDYQVKLTHDTYPSQTRTDQVNARVLVLDIETAPLLANIWGIWNQNINLEAIHSDWFMLTWAAKWLFEKKVYSARVTPKEAIANDDKRIVKSLIEMLNQADVVIGHNCIEVSTPILKSDLTWVCAGDVKVGDKLIGFEEGVKPGTPTRTNKKWNGVKTKRKIKLSTVTSFAKEMKRCLKVTFDNGDEVTTTYDHYWLGMAEKDRNQRWYKTENLRIGQRVNKFCKAWDTDLSYESGWMSGFISGEGTLKGNRNGGISSIDFCQRPTVVLDQAIDYCKKLDIPISKLSERKGGLGRGDTLYAFTLGGKWKTIEILGRLRINRLINKINWDKFGGLGGVSGDNSPVKTCIITKIEDVGYKEVAVITTDEKTFIANGYPMHNCDKFDLPRINTRAIIHRIPPPLPYLSIDTLKVAKREFAFTSNKLDYINKMLKLPQKEETNMQLWRDCFVGKEAGLKKMEKYNINDVIIHEQTYLTMRPYIKSHPNMGLHIIDDAEHCPSCGSSEIKDTGKAYQTALNTYETFRCTNCSSIGRRRKANKKSGKVTSSVAR